MTTALPNGYVTILEAADMLQAGMHAGLPDLPIVTKLRQEGLGVNDGPARDRAIVELWKAVDKGALRSMAVGGRPRRVIRLSAQFTSSVPGLRSPRGRGFTLLRQSNAAYDDLDSWFGPSFHRAIVAIRPARSRGLRQCISGTSFSRSGGKLSTCGELISPSSSRMWPSGSNRSINRRMTAVLPIGYATILEAAEMLQQALHAGVPDLPIVTKLRQEGTEVNDGSARDRAIAELWKAVDQGTLRSMAIGGLPRRIIRLDAQFTKGVPALRSPRGRGFTLLRPSNPAYHELITWFGPSFPTATVAFRVTEVQKVARGLMRARRIAQRTNGQKKPRGRSSLIATVQPVIKDVVDRRKWDATMTMKALTREVNRAGKWQQPVSEDTVIRAFDGLYEQTGDRRLERVRQPRRPRSSGSS